MEHRLTDMLEVVRSITEFTLQLLSVALIGVYEIIIEFYLFFKRNMMAFCFFLKNEVSGLNNSRMV